MSIDLSGVETESGISFEKFQRLLRAKPNSLDAYLGTTEVDVALLDSTKTTVHVRSLLIDGNGKPRFNDLAERMAQELISYSIPRSDIKIAKELDRTHDTKHIVKLYRKAKNLFTHLQTSGEGGEMLLYLLIETYLGIPQLLCKMPLKTSSEMHFHGADGVHCKYDESSEDLCIYWGESKLHKKMSKAIGSCFESLKPFVKPSGGSKSAERRDLELLTDNLDLCDPALEAAILKYLNPDDVKFNQLKYRGAALVGFDTGVYSSDDKVLSNDTIRDSVIKAATSWTKSMSGYLEKHDLKEIEIEIFCIPFLSVEEFRASVFAELDLA